MTQITTEDVQKLAQLSSLQLSDDEIEPLRQDLENILRYIDQLSELNTEGIEPTYQVTGLESVWRKDEVDSYNISRDQLLATSPDTKDYQIKVPKVL